MISTEAREMFDRELRTLSHVPRWGIIRRIQQQNVAEHSYYVAMYTYQIMEFFNYGTFEERYKAMVYVLHHDVSEILLSDIPHHTKKLINQIDLEKCERSIERDIFNYNRPTFNHATINIIKVADLLDSLFYLHTEKNLGNNDISEVIRDIEHQINPYLEGLPGESQKIDEFIHLIKTKVQEEYQKKSGYGRSSTVLALGRE